MKQLTRDLYTSGRVWLSLSHNFSQKSGDKEFDLVKVNRDFVTLNSGALFVLSFWSTGFKTPDKFYLPEYKIEEFRSILISLNELKDDEAYIRDGELTAQAKPSTLYYRLVLSNKKFFDVYFVENNFNGDKAINIAIEFDSKVYFLYDSNVIDLIEIIPTASEIVKYKQSAAELYYMSTYLLNGSVETTKASPKAGASKQTVAKKKAAPRTAVTKVDRTKIDRPDIIIPTHEEEPEDIDTVEVTEGFTKPVVTKPIVEEVIQKEDPIVVVEESTEPVISQSGVDYSKLLEDD